MNDRVLLEGLAVVRRPVDTETARVQGNIVEVPVRLAPHHGGVTVAARVERSPIRKGRTPVGGAGKPGVPLAGHHAVVRVVVTRADGAGGLAHHQRGLALGGARTGVPRRVADRHVGARVRLPDLHPRLLPHLAEKLGPVAGDRELEQEAVHQRTLVRVVEQCARSVLRRLVHLRLDVRLLDRCRRGLADRGLLGGRRHHGDRQQDCRSHCGASPQPPCTHSHRPHLPLGPLSGFDPPAPPAAKRRLEDDTPERVSTPRASRHPAPVPAPRNDCGGTSCRAPTGSQ